MSTTQVGYTPLMDAAWKGMCNVVIELLHNGADIEAQTHVSHINTVTVMSKYLTSAIFIAASSRAIRWKYGTGVYISVLMNMCTIIPG